MADLTNPSFLTDGKEASDLSDEGLLCFLFNVFIVNVGQNTSSKYILKGNLAEIVQCTVFEFDAVVEKTD